MKNTFWLSVIATAAFWGYMYHQDEIFHAQADVVEAMHQVEMDMSKGEIRQLLKNRYAAWKEHNAN